MNGVLIDTVKYMEGHSDLGDETYDVKLIAFPTNLTVVNIVDDRPLFSIPWGNLENIKYGLTEKTGMAYASSFLAGMIPGVHLTNAASYHHRGIFISFSDEEIQRTQKVFLSTRTEGMAKQIMKIIMRYRDNYFRTLHRASGPTQRE
jgi:hypothetical protein